MAAPKSKAKSGTVYACRECGDTTSKWSGKCLSCGTWDSLVEVSATSLEEDSQKRGLGDVGEALRLTAAPPQPLALTEGPRPDVRVIAVCCGGHAGTRIRRRTSVRN